MPYTPTLKLGIAAAMSTKPSVNLIRGRPNANLLPSDLFHSASASLCADTNAARDALQYGPDGGFLPLRKELSRWLTDFLHSQRSDFHRQIMHFRRCEPESCAPFADIRRPYIHQKCMDDQTYALSCLPVSLKMPASVRRCEVCRRTKKE